MTGARREDGPNFNPVFAELRSILDRHAECLIRVTDKVDSYYLDTPHIMANKKPLFFGAVQIRKGYVSFHLMPVYVFPKLLEGISPELRKRMQGKSCFNFRKPDPKLFRELDELTKLGFAAYRRAGYV